MRHRCLDNPLRGLCVFSPLDTLSGLILSLLDVESVLISSLLDVESALISSFLDVHCTHFTLAVHHVTMLQVAIRIWWPFQKGKLVRLLKLAFKFWWKPNVHADFEVSAGAKLRHSFKPGEVGQFAYSPSCAMKGADPSAGVFLRTNLQIQGYLLEQADEIEK